VEVKAIAVLTGVEQKVVARVVGLLVKGPQREVGGVTALVALSVSISVKLPRATQYAKPWKYWTNKRIPSCTP
jgi:hypothetical protein